MSFRDTDYNDVTGLEETEAAKEHLERERGAKKPQQEDSGKEDHPSEKFLAEDFVDEVVDKVSRATPRGYNGDSGQLPFIYVVPRDLAEGRKGAYEPAAVCIGPLYHGAEREKEAFLKLERYKWCCVRKLIVHAAGTVAGAWIPDVHAPLLRKCLYRMGDLEQQIRTSYGVSISMDAIGGGDRQALMMLLDGCFVLHRLLKYARLDRRRYDEDDDDDDWTQVIGRYGVWGMATRDLLLLKNQVPFFVLVELFQHLKSRARDHEGILIDGGLRLFAQLRPGGPGNEPSTIACSDVRHLFYLSIRLSPLPESSSSSRQHDELIRLGWVPCAKELEEAGVRFRARVKAKTFLDVSFHGGGVLEIPPLQLYDSSEALFRNLIAFEQTYLDTPGHVTSYAIFMDCLIKTPEDMRLLHQSGVLVSHMNGDRDDDTGFFSRVCAQAHTSPDRNYLNAVMRDVLRYQNRRCPRWCALLLRNHFSNPWVTISLVAAAFLLLMNVLRTFFSVYGYFKPPATN